MMDISNTRVSDLTATQAQSTLKLSRIVARNKENDEGLKALLAASNDSCFFIKINPKIHQKKDKWYIIINRRPKKTCLKGKRVNSR